MGDINLAGYITGYGIVHKDGTVTEHHYDKPIHNKIVKTGINQLLRYNGSNTGGYYLYEDGYYSYNCYSTSYNNCYPIFRGNLGTHYGCLHFCQLGSNNDPTNFFDTNLNQPFGEKSTNIKNNSPYTYTYITDAYTYNIWITHTFPAFNETKEIGEIGYFGRYQSDPNDDTTIVYPMFSRIALPQKITVQEGEEFFATYKLVITIDSEAKSINDFMGIAGQKALMKYCPYCPTTGNLKDIVGYNDISTDDAWRHLYIRVPFPAIDSYGNKYYPILGRNNERAYTRYFCFPQVHYNMYDTRDANLNHTTNSQDFIQISKTDRNFRSITEINQSNSVYTDYMNLQRYNQNGTHEFVDYDPNKNYRDIKLILPKYNPNLDTVDNQSITFYNIYCRGYEYRLGYYDENMVWHPQPMTKWVNEKWEFTCRTTITTEDTEAWQNGTLTP